MAARGRQGLDLVKATGGEPGYLSGSDLEFAAGN